MPLAKNVWRGTNNLPVNGITDLSNLTYKKVRKNLWKLISGVDRGHWNGCNLAKQIVGWLIQFLDSWAGEKFKTVKGGFALLTGCLRTLASLTRSYVWWSSWFLCELSVQWKADVSWLDAARFMKCGFEAMEENQSERWRRVTWRRGEGAWVSTRRRISVLNWSAMMSSWTAASEATSCLNCCMSIARRFLAVRRTGRGSGLAISRELITGSWSGDRPWQTETDRRKAFSSLWTTRQRVCPQRWVGTLAAWKKRKDRVHEMCGVRVGQALEVPVKISSDKHLTSREVSVFQKITELIEKDRFS